MQMRQIKLPFRLRWLLALIVLGGAISPWAPQPFAEQPIPNAYTGPNEAVAALR